VTLPTDHVQAAIRNETRLAIAVSGLVLLLGSAMAILGAKSVSRPLANVTEMTKRIAGGGFTQRIETAAKNEIGTLAASFNEMTRRLKESIKYLKETTAAKERTPPTSLAGTKVAKISNSGENHPSGYVSTLLHNPKRSSAAVFQGSHSAVVKVIG
jgi:methyl-accepting chemotaxis protein